MSLRRIRPALHQLLIVAPSTPEVASESPATFLFAVNNKNRPRIDFRFDRKQTARRCGVDKVVDRWCVLRMQVKYIAFRSLSIRKQTLIKMAAMFVEVHCPHQSCVQPDSYSTSSPTFAIVSKLVHSRLCNSEGFCFVFALTHLTLLNRKSLAEAQRIYARRKR